MPGWLLDTNVLSELRKGSDCDARVRKWLESVSDEEFFVSVLALGEIRQGIERIRRRDPAQARALEKWLNRIQTDYADRILPVDEKIADQWGRLGISQPLPVIDAYMAATALAHDLIVVTRDESGFRRTGAATLNPFSQ